MPSEKRQRQRALREQKQAVIAKSRKRRTALRRGTLIVIVGAVIVLIVFLVTGRSKPAATSSTSTTTSSVTSTTSGGPTTQPLTTAAVAPTCPPTTGSTTRVVWFTKAPPDCIGKDSVWQATFNTTLGPIVATMDAAKSYAAVNNFVFLALWQYYNGTVFHRVIPGFVVQGGDPTGTGTGGPHRYPGYFFTGNFPPASCKTTPTGPGCYVPGDLVLANGNTNPSVQNASSDGSQFFFVLPGGQKTLNSEPTYTNFGAVTSGMSVVERIGADGSSSGTPTVKVYINTLTVKEISKG